eukprot:917788-Alexandrium_andersonii.AAC.1
MAKATQALADAEGFAVARLDGTSAFNSQDRATALNRLGEVSPGPANGVAQFYGSTSTRWAQEGGEWQCLRCDTGWAQGGPAAPIAYTAGVGAAVRAARAEAQELTSAIKGGPTASKAQ